MTAWLPQLLHIPRRGVGYHHPDPRRSSIFWRRKPGKAPVNVFMGRAAWVSKIWMAGKCDIESRPCYDYDSECFFYTIFELIYLYGVGIENYSS